MINFPDSLIYYTTDAIQFGWLLPGWLLLAFSLCKTPLGENRCLGNPYILLTGCLSIQFLIHLPFPNTVSYTAFGYLLLTVQHLCDLRDAMLCHWSPGASHPVFNIIPHLSVSYCRVFTPISYFQPSSSQSDLRLCPPNPYIGKQRISLGLAIILSMCLRSHT